MLTLYENIENPSLNIHLFKIDRNHTLWSEEPFIKVSRIRWLFTQGGCCYLIDNGPGGYRIYEILLGSGIEQVYPLNDGLICAELTNEERNFFYKNLDVIKDCFSIPEAIQKVIDETRKAS